MQDEKLGRTEFADDELAPLSLCRVGDLACAERLLLAGIRLWVARFRERRCGLPDLLTLFEAYRLRPVAAGLHGLLLLTACGATRPVEIRARGALELACDEARIVAAIACAQSAGAEAAAALLGEWLPPGQARLAGAAAAEIAVSCRWVRLSLPCRPLGGLAEAGLLRLHPGRPRTLH